MTGHEPAAVERTNSSGMIPVVSKLVLAGDILEGTDARSMPWFRLFSLESSARETVCKCSGFTGPTKGNLRLPPSQKIPK